MSGKHLLKRGLLIHADMRMRLPLRLRLRLCLRVRIHACMYAFLLQRSSSAPRGNVAMRRVRVARSGPL